MTRHTSARRAVKLRVVIEVAGVRDESDHHRHNWFVEAFLGELHARGTNVAAVTERLEAELLELVRSPGAREAVLRERSAAAEVYRREADELGVEAAAARAHIRACGRDPDAPQVDPETPEDIAP